MNTQKRPGRKKSIIWLSIIGVFILIFSVLTVLPFNLGINDYVPVVNNISLGIDLKGGVYVLMEASNIDKDGNVMEDRVFDDTVEGTITVLTNRLVAKGFTEATVVRQGDNRIRIEIPDVENTEEIFDLIGKPARLEFKDENGTVLLTGSDLETAYATYEQDQNSTNYGKAAVGLKFNAEGTVKFAEATRNNLNKKISIYVDDNLVSEPTVNQEITGGNAIISPMESYEAAQNLAIQLQSGALPLTLETKESGSISPTLGQDALKGGLIAGVIGLVLVMIFMVIYYRGLGVVASISLYIYTLLLLYVLAGMPIAFSLKIIPQAQMTLPGIAGIILSIGMAIDANVIIYERIKDEYKLGKSFESSFKTGFKRSAAAIIDSNVTTLIAGIVLYIFGQGTIKGFAHVLIVGIVLSVFCGLIVSKSLIKLFMGIGLRDKFFGVKREDEPSFDKKVINWKFNIIENKKKFLTISLSVIFAGLLMVVIFGLNRGIDFTGGTIVTVNVGHEIENGDNFKQISDTVNSTINDYARENGLTIDKNTPQMAGTENTRGITVRYNVKNVNDAERNEIDEALIARIGENIKAKMADLNIPVTNFKTDTATVGGSVSAELVLSAFYSVALAAVLMLIYLAFRFELLMGAAAVLALLHDVFIMVAFVAIFRYQINSSFIAAMITIIGYSINSTIVIFDRVRENTKRLSLKEASYSEIGNKSIKETLMRSINTSITTLFTIFILFILGVSSIKEFAFPIIIGLIAGGYSSVFLAVSIWVMLKNFADKQKKIREARKAAAPANAKMAKAN
jgi:SecD/SecF fusion protein